MGGAQHVRGCVAWYTRCKTRGCLLGQPQHRHVERRMASVLVEGYMDKKTRSIFSGWQPRYFVLIGEMGARAATLQYWESERTYTSNPLNPRGEISMNVMPGQPLGERAPALLPSMRIKLPGRTWEFRTKEKDRIDPWVGAFKRLADARAEHEKALDTPRPAPQSQLERDPKDSFNRGSPGSRIITGENLGSVRIAVVPVLTDCRS